MTLKKKYADINTKPIATQTICNCGGVVILDINSDTVVTAFEFGNGYDGSVQNFL